MVSAIGLGQLFLVVVSLLFDRDRELNCNRNLAMKTVAVLSALSPTIIILLLGKQGSLIALALQELIFLLFLWYCIKLQCLRCFLTLVICSVNSHCQLSYFWTYVIFRVRWMCSCWSSNPSSGSWTSISGSAPFLAWSEWPCSPSCLRQVN